MRREGKGSVVVTGASGGIGSALGKVISHEAPPRHTKAPDLDRATELIEKQAARREALFKESAEDEKTKPQLLERKFEEALKKAKDEPAGPTLRDIDLD